MPASGRHLPASSAHHAPLAPASCIRRLPASSAHHAALAPVPCIRPRLHSLRKDTPRQELCIRARLQSCRTSIQKRPALAPEYWHGIASRSSGCRVSRGPQRTGSLGWRSGTTVEAPAFRPGNQERKTIGALAPALCIRARLQSCRTSVQMSPALAPEYWHGIASRSSGCRVSRGPQRTGSLGWRSGTTVEAPAFNGAPARLRAGVRRPGNQERKTIGALAPVPCIRARLQSCRTSIQMSPALAAAEFRPVCLGLFPQAVQSCRKRTPKSGALARSFSERCTLNAAPCF